MNGWMNGYMDNTNQDIYIYIHILGHFVRNWKKRFFVMQDGILYYFKDLDDFQVKKYYNCYRPT